MKNGKIKKVEIGTNMGKRGKVRLMGWKGERLTKTEYKPEDSPLIPNMPI